ncbi:MAG: 30S ribosomal protein S18 [Chloroflexota bacterium]
MARDVREMEPEEEQSSTGEDREAGRRRFTRHPRLCQFCAEKATLIDYKQAEMLKRFVTEQGRIRSRRQTGTCARHQRVLARAIKRARHMALLPFSASRFR